MVSKRYNGNGYAIKGIYDLKRNRRREVIHCDHLDFRLVDLVGRPYIAYGFLLKAFGTMFNRGNEKSNVIRNSSVLQYSFTGHGHIPFGVICKK